MRYTSGTGETGAPIDVRDPMAERLRAIWEKGGTFADTVTSYLAIEEIFPARLATDPDMRNGLITALATLMDEGAEKAAARLAL
jgi:fructuronate reductase